MCNFNGQLQNDEPSHQDLHCLPFCFEFSIDTPICISGHVHIQGWKSPLKKFKDERVNRHLIIIWLITSTVSLKQLYLAQFTV